MERCSWKTGAEGRHVPHTLKAKPTTLPRVSWETEALDAGRKEETAMCSSSLSTRASIGKTSLSALGVLTGG